MMFGSLVAGAPRGVERGGLLPQKSVYEMSDDELLHLNRSLERRNFITEFFFGCEPPAAELCLCASA